MRKQTPSPQKPSHKTPAEAQNGELHWAVDQVINSRTIGKITGEFILQALWVHRTGDNAKQVNFSRHFRACIEEWVSGGAR